MKFGSSSRRNSHPDWDEIRQLLKQVAIRQDRAEKRQDRADKRMDRLEELMDRTAREQKARDLAWFAKQEALQAKADKEREAEQRRRAKQEAQQAKERAKQQAAWEAQQAAWEAQQAAWEARQAKEREEYQRRMEKQEEKQARDREEDRRRMAKIEKEQARQQTVWEAQRARDLAELKEIAKRIQKDVGGITNTFGNIAEEYFLQAWENCDPVRIGPIKFTQVLAKQTYRGHGREMECDLVLLNGTHIAITEVKLSLDSRDVHTFHTKLKEVLPLVLPAAYRHLRVIPVMACTLMTKQARQSVVDHGFALLRPYGQQARLEIKHLRTWPPVNTVPGP